MDSYEIKMLRQELEALKTQVAELKATQSKDRAESVKAFNGLDDNCFKHISDLKAAQDNDRTALYKSISTVRNDTFEYIANIYDLLWPVFHQAFPEYSKIKKQIDVIIRQHGKGRQGKEKS
jgi:hypothetical protein